MYGFLPCDSGLIAIATIAIGVPLFLYLHKTWWVTPQNEAFHLRQQIRIINCRDLATGQPLPDRYEARTVPNQRLKTTFGIDNIFTTQDIEWRSQFRKLAVDTLRKALKLDAGAATPREKPDWSLLVGSMKSAVQQYLQAEGDSINLAKLVQFVTLKVSNGYLFDVPEQQVLSSKKNDAIMLIADRINELWIQSKGDNAPTWHEEHALIQNLLAVIPNHDPHDPRSNPMNLILPAYETMWRVVFRGLLEVRFRGDHEDDHVHYKELLTTYLDEPNNADNWRARHDTLNSNPNRHRTVSTLDVVKEILRLYPPTRRIYRKYPDREPFISADIEQMQRNRTLAGDDPQAFRPARWQEIRRRFDSQTERQRDLKQFEEDLGFMPFARVCPAGSKATHAFGWKMIALLTGSLIQGLDRLDGEWALRAGEKRDALPACDRALESGREDYLSLVYEKTELD